MWAGSATVSWVFLFWFGLTYQAKVLTITHELRTPNEGIDQRNLKIWADMADKICFGRT